MDELEPLDSGNVLATATVIGAVEIAIAVLTWLVWRRVTG